MRTPGRSGIEVSDLGMGCWAIGGPFWYGERPIGWGEVDDAESERAIRRALDLGRTLAQGALGWIWARSPLTIPIPGCRTVAQVEENVGALAHGPPPAQLTEISALLGAASA